MKLWNIDVMIGATLYIKAETVEEALKIARATKDDSLELMGQGGEVPIDGGRFRPDMPEISLSPTMTIHGPFPGYSPQFVEEF